MNPTQFVNLLLDQHFYPWNCIKYENALIEKKLKENIPNPEEMKVIKKYLTYEILRDFKHRMYRRYDRSLPLFSLDYYMKLLSVAVIERNFDQDRIEYLYSDLLNDIKKRDPDFNLRTFIDNLIRLRFMSTKISKAINAFENVHINDPNMKRFKIK